jgi:hypothetical protein
MGKVFGNPFKGFELLKGFCLILPSQKIWDGIL